MNKLLCSFIALSLVSGASAQQAESYKKRPTLVFNGSLNDFTTAARIKSSSLASVLNNNDWTRAADMTPVLGVRYLQGLSEHVDANVRLDMSFLNYPFTNRPAISQDRALFQADAGVNVKLLSDRYIFTPYLHAGVGAQMYSAAWFGAYAPLGGGLQFNLGKGNTFVFSDFQYRVGLTDGVANHFNYSLGVGTPIVAKKEKPLIAPPPPPPPAPVDTDKDGIVDSLDKCPTVAGIAKYKGCPIPDTDKDGINDENDKCPTVAGVAKYDGCPVPDTDKDGINDEEDKCPTVAGLARYKGCPIPDTDGDGINDEEDKCPTVAGVASNNGCPDVAPVLNNIAKSIYFTTGTARFAVPKRAQSKLDSVVILLQQYPNLTLDIEGHTDNTGSAKVNKALSQKRADAIVKAITTKGIAADRLKATGYGSEKPVASNKTAKGRGLNRRTEIIGKFN